MVQAFVCLFFFSSKGLVESGREKDKMLKAFQVNFSLWSCQFISSFFSKRNHLKRISEDCVVKSKLKRYDLCPPFITFLPIILLKYLTNIFAFFIGVH